MKEEKFSILDIIFRIIGISTKRCDESNNTIEKYKSEEALKNIMSLDNLKNPLDLYSSSIDDYGDITTYTIDREKVDIDGILKNLPFTPESVNSYLSSNVYINVRNKHLDRHFNKDEIVKLNKLVYKVYSTYLNLSDLERKEFDDSFSMTLEKLLNFMKSMDIVNFKEENYKITIGILESILEHVEKEKMSKVSDLRKELEIEAEYLKKIKENPLYF